MTFTMSTEIPKRFDISTPRLIELKESGKAEKISYEAEARIKCRMYKLSRKDISALKKIGTMAKKLAKRLPAESDSHGNEMERITFPDLDICYKHSQALGISSINSVDYGFYGTGKCITTGKHMFVTCTEGDLVYYRGSQASIDRTIEDYKEFLITG